MIRDVLTSLPGLATWPCDEINYIWRYGNARYPSDEVPASRATSKTVQYIRRQIDWVARRYGASMVVEKTCANSLRVPFVDSVLPNAKYLFIHRDGLDSMVSAENLWRARPRAVHIARKARFVPKAYIPYYAARYLGYRISRPFVRRERQAIGGPQPHDVGALLANYSKIQVCAIQWKRCVDAAAAAFDAMPKDRWLEIGYEDFVTAPERQLERITGFLQLTASDVQRDAALQGIHANRVGKSRDALDDETVKYVLPLIRDTLARYGYV